MLSPQSRTFRVPLYSNAITTTVAVTVIAIIIIIIEQLLGFA